MKKFLKEAFVNSQSITYHRVSNFFALLTIISIISLVLETVPSLDKYSKIFFVAEWVAVILFTGEYIGRLMVSKPKWKYSISFFGVVDLVAIVPTFLGLGNLTFIKSARSLRIIRLLRMARLAKMARSGPKTDEMSVAGLNILIYFSVLLMALLLTGTLMFLFENGSDFNSIPAGMWWSFKVFMAGIPVAEPMTTAGETMFVLTRFIGLLLLGLLIGVIGNVFRFILMGKK